jgi:hypothetical protein
MRRMEDRQDDDLGPGGINWLASLVDEGTAKREDAIRLISEFVRQSRSGKIEPRLIEHVRNCFLVFLAGERILVSWEAGPEKAARVSIGTLDKAFGLTRAAPGRAPMDQDDLREAAMQVLAIRLSDAAASLEQASSDVAEQRKNAGLSVSSDSQVRDAWARYKQDGLLWLRISRLTSVDPSAPAWTEKEMQRLTELFETEPWFVPPGVNATDHIKATLERLSRPSAD